ncbi:MAG TPA: hypothetical protein VJ124_14955 [Pyrinomonadaceae bacterium]|nr:hypothetical protein [Pyrinomonadaceae bacterium]
MKRRSLNSAGRIASILISCLSLALFLSFPISVRAAEPVTPCIPEPTDMTTSYGNLISCSIDNAGDTDLFRFTGTNGEPVVAQVTYQSGAMRPCIQLIAPDNTTTTACNNAFFNRIDITLNQTGTYTILVDVFFSGTIGNYSLALERLIPPSPNAGAVQHGITYENTLDASGDLDLFVLDGEVNTTVRIQATYQSGSMRPCMELIAPDNSRMTACNNAFSNSIDTTLSQSGPYVILIRDWFSTSTGNYALAIERVRPPSANAQLLPYGSTIATDINSSGDLDLFTFRGVMSTTIRLQATWQSGSLRPCIELVAPDNARTTACSNAFSNSIQATLNQSGTYAVLVTDWFSTSTGNYTITLQCLVGYCVNVYLPLIQR